MADDIFHWTMSAAAHKQSINTLVEEIREAHRSGSELPLRLVLDLLPVQTDQKDEITSRGSFLLDGSRFVNAHDESLWIEFYDPVLEEFSATVPATWSGTLRDSGTILEITFDQPLELEIQRLSSLGVDRSAFQLLEGMQVSTKASISRLLDSISREKITLIQANIEEDLDESDIIDFNLYNEAKAAASMSASTSRVNPTLLDSNGDGGGNSVRCAPGSDEAEWYVYQRGIGVCLVHHGVIMGRPGYLQIYGPAAKDECEEFRRNSANCN